MGQNKLIGFKVLFYFKILIVQTDLNNWVGRVVQVRIEFVFENIVIKHLCSLSVLIT